MKSILLFFGVLKMQSAHVHSFLLLVISNCKLLINPRVDSFLSRLSLLKATKNICFFSFAFYLPYPDLSLGLFVFKESISLAQVCRGIAILNEWKPSLNKLVGNEGLKTSVWFNGSLVFGPQLSFFYRIVEKTSCNEGSCDSFILIIGYLNQFLVPGTQKYN